MQLGFIKKLCRISLLGLVIWASGCGTVPKPKPLTAEEQIHIDSKVGLTLAKDFDAECSFKHDGKVENYLNKVARRLADAVPELKTTPIAVVILSDRNKRWQNYALPGNRIYLSVGLLRGMEFENEIAAAIAFQLGHILKRHAVLHYEKDFKSLPNLRGIFDFNEMEDVAASQSGVNVLYRAGYDPRGLVSLWEQYQNNLQHSPYKADTLSTLTEKTRQAIALNTPLRNPIVRSQAFLTVKKRIQKL